jgi:hypothetical protein
MSFVAATIDILRASTTVMDMVGAGIYADQAQQGAPLPYIVVEEVNEEPENTITGGNTARFGIVHVNGFTRGSGEARDLETAMFAALQDFYGTAGGIEIQTAWVSDSVVSLESPRDGSGQGIRQTQLTYNLWE